MQIGPHEKWNKALKVNNWNTTCTNGDGPKRHRVSWITTFSPWTIFSRDLMQKISAGISLIGLPRNKNPGSPGKTSVFELCAPLMTLVSLSFYLYNSSSDHWCHQRIDLELRHTFFPCLFYVSIPECQFHRGSMFQKHRNVNDDSPEFHYRRTRNRPFWKRQGKKRICN